MACFLRGGRGVKCFWRVEVRDNSGIPVDGTVGIIAGYNELAKYSVSSAVIRHHSVTGKLP